MFNWIDINVFRRGGIVVVVLLVLIVGHSSRIEHIDYVSNLGNGDTIQVDPKSPTGYADGRRKLIIPERNVQTYQWIMQGQQMLDEGVLNLERVEYDNAPDGRPVLSPSLYRWLLAGLAWMISFFTGYPFGVSVERAALYVDPGLQALAIVLVVVLMRRLPLISTVVFAVGAIALFPLGASFFPGQADDSTLTIIFNLFSVLPLLIAVAESWNRGGTSISRRLTILAGVSGGCALWLSPSGGGSLLLAIVGAGALARVLRKLRRRKVKLPATNLTDIKWQIWARSGAISIIAVWLLENGFSVLEASAWKLNLVNPIYAVIWLFLGESLRSLNSDVQSTGRWGVVRTWIFWILGFAGIVYLMTAKLDWKVNQIGLDLSRASLPSDSGGTISFLMGSDSSPFIVFALIIPILIVVFSILHIVRTRGEGVIGDQFLLAIIPLLVVLTLAVYSMGWWGHFQALALAWGAIAVSLKGVSAWYRFANIGTLLISFVFGSVLVFNDLLVDSQNVVSEGELVSLVERDFADWISLRQNPERPVVLSSPNSSASIAYYGNLKVLSTPYSENLDGFSAAVRLSSAATADEAQAIASGRSIDYIIDPPWDVYLEEYAAIGSNEIDQSFVLMLKRWLPPLWLRPMSYRIPQIEGFEHERVFLFRTIENQRQEDALARLTEFFIDAKLAENAMRVHAALAMNFPDKLVTHLTRAELALALGDKSKLKEGLTGLLVAIDRGEAAYIEWDFRVNMALVLLGGNEVVAAKKQLEICAEQASEEGLRQLSEGSLQSFEQILRALKWKLPTEELDEYLTKLVR